ncbi:hypothetical protein KGO95_01150 [Patescibacteria group bacterium]|nr:hypothetical protein [Patescibacteria group bacterium]
MDTKDTEEKKCEKMCHEHGRGMCLGCMWRKHSVWHWVIALLILALVFVVGFKLGELKARFDSRFDAGYLMGPTGRIWSRNAGPAAGTWGEPTATTTQMQ